MALKVVPFTPKKVEEDKPVSLPTPEELEKRGIGKLRGVICLLQEEETGNVTRYIDGLNFYEAIGVMEEAKLGILDEIGADDDEEE